MSPTTRWSWSGFRASRRLVPVAATLLVALAVASIGLPQGEEPVATSRPSPTTRPAATSRPGATPSPAAVPAAWAPVELEAVASRADLTPTRSTAAGIQTDTAFVLRSLGDTSAEELVRSLTVAPSLDFLAKPGPDASSITLTPAAPLDPGAQYRFQLRLADGSLAGSWAFQVPRPPQVVTTLPGDGATSVPVDSGIEITFDQDGVGDPQPYFSIVPAVQGSFERHGRTFVFVPDLLAQKTVYTVTLRKGVPLTGTSLALERDIRFQFETESGGTQPPARVTLVLGRPMIEAGTQDAPAVALDIWGTQETEAPTSLDVSLHRLPTVDAALAALDALRAAPSWARWRTTPVVPTSGLTRISSFTARVEKLAPQGGQFVRLPSRLPAGWYLATFTGASRPEQTILQVTDVATYTAASVTRTVVWVNDVARGAALGGAQVRLLDGTLLGRTDARGLLDVATPAVIVATARRDWSDARQDPPALVVQAPDGRRAVVPIDLSSISDLYPRDESGGYWDPADQYWRLLYTDRTLYRPDDQLNAWGLIRERDGNRVPTDAELQLVSGAAGSSGAPPIASARLSADAGGSFAATLPLHGVPFGGYYLELHADGRQIASTAIQVGVIRKPAYQLAVSTDSRAHVAGDAIEVTAQASFYDGTPVPAVDLRITASATDESTTQATTDASGRATATLSASGPDPTWSQTADASQGTYDRIEVSPARAEEGEIAQETSVLVFASGVFLDGTGTVTGGRVVVRGTLHDLDLVAVDRQLAAGEEEVDPRGTPIASGAIQARVVERVEVRQLAGHSYDFINKRAVDLYDYDIEEREIYTGSLTTDATGRYTLSIPAPSADDDYKVYLTARDDRGRVETVVAGASPPQVETQGYPTLEADVPCFWWTCRYDIGQAMPLTMRDQNGTMPSGGSNRYLFLRMQRGIREVVVQGSPRLATTFRAADAPSISVEGVRFTGSNYEVALYDFRAFVETADRELAISLATDARQYRPGGTVRLDVRTTDATGHPVPATVTLRAVDEKLFDIGGAAEADPVADLYRSVGSGLLYSHTSHPVPLPPSGGGMGSATGARDDFRDTLLFQQVETDADGRAQTSFSLSDDLTSWRVSASGVSRNLLAGESSVVVPVGLPFFVETTLAPEYLSADRPSIGLRAYGSALRAGDAVTFTVSSRSLSLPRTTVTGTAFTQVDVPLPALTPGMHDIAIAGSSGSGTTGLSDRLTRTFTVLDSRLAETHTAYSVLEEGAGPGAPPGTSGTGMTTYTVTDAGRGQFVPLLESLAWSGGARLDQALAQAWARDLLIREFGRDPDSLPPATFDPARYQREDGAVSLLPYSSVDSVLAVELAVLAPDRLDANRLQYALQSAFGTNDPLARTREQNAMALAGTASLGGATLVEVRSALAQPDLTTRERLYLALAAEAVGDDSTARSIERALLQAGGEQMGAWVRLRVGATLDDTLEATALLALIAAGLGDPIAAQAEAYVRANHATDQLFSLHELSYVQRVLARTPAAAAGFAWSVDGTRYVVDLGPGEAETLTFTAAQRATFVLEPLRGRVAVAASWQVPLDATAVQRDPSLTLARSVSPSGALSGSDVVQVTLRATFGPQAVDGPYQVIDLLPSGLAPVTRYAAWPSGGDSVAATSSPEEPVIWPYAVEGQRVLFSISPTTKQRSFTLRYLARVVTAGSYAWEPAIIQAVAASQSVNLTAGGMVEIR